MKKVVLIIDDEPGIRQDLYHWLSLMDFVVHTAAAVDEAKHIINSDRVDFAIVDLKVDFRSEVGGAEVLHYLKRNQPQAQTIILSAHDFTDEIQLAVEGVYDGYISKGGKENYIRSVVSKIKSLSAEPPKRKCFVIMPFSKTSSCRSKDWTEIYCNVIKPAVEGAGFNYKCMRSDGLAGNIIEDILDNLNRADLVIADLTDRNPNVFYELGVRHALRRGTILITQKIAHVPFDLVPYAIQEYRWITENEKNEFAQRLRQVIAELESNPDRGASPVLKYLGKQ
ncbi:MAG: response regulator [Desulfobulbaceae bacterium]|nr:response regulator [Desulfobulbaceae bacterium]